MTPNSWWKAGEQLMRATGSPRGGLSRATIALILGLAAVSSTSANYTPDGTKPAGPGVYQNPGDGICVIGLKLDGTMLVDWSIKNARDCGAWTRSADGTVDLVGMTTQATCVNATSPVVAPNDGYRHGWSTGNRHR